MISFLDCFEISIELGCSSKKAKKNISAYQVSYVVSLPDNGQLDVKNLLKTEAIVSHPKNIAHKFQLWFVYLNWHHLDNNRQYVTLHGKTVNKVIARARHGPNTFARYLSNTLSVRICKKKTKEIE